MARWTDLAQWRGPSPNQSGAMRAHLGVVVHIADGSYEGTISWQRNPSAEVSSNFIVARDGRIAQMVDTDVTAWTQRAGNGSWLSIENEGRTGQALTAQQIEANARILAKAHQAYGVPLQVTNTPAKRGLGHHSMGAENGIDWGHSECPGPAIKAQKPAIVARAIEIINGKSAQEDDMSAATEQVQQLSNAMFLGGPSMGRSVDPDGTGARPAGNSVVTKLDYIMATAEAALAAARGVDGQAILAEIRQQATRQQQALQELPGKLAADLGPAVLAEVRDALGDVDDQALEAAVQRGVRSVLGSLDNQPG